MKAILIWLSGVSLICAAGYWSGTQVRSFGSTLHAPFVMSLLGMELLCADTGRVHGLPTLACTALAGSPAPRAEPSMMPSWRRTLRPWT